jgi:hypothetical protein
MRLVRSTITMNAATLIAVITLYLIVSSYLVSFRLKISAY